MHRQGNSHKFAYLSMVYNVALESLRKLDKSREE